ncbi:MAG: putative metal-binding motif-containing protein [Sandaracinus sp.]
MLSLRARRASCTFASLLWSCAALVASCGGPAGGEDAGASDAAVDASGPCTSAADCDDGLFCNGAEACTADGRCVSGPLVVCDDGIACTTDGCSERDRRCVAAPPDADGDGYGDARCVDGTGTALGADCDDADAARYPGNHEVCDAGGHDEDCDEATHGAVDADFDGYEDARCCNGTACGDDCDDAHASAHPGGAEVCNLVDDDCDASIDENVATAGYADTDHDGYGDAAAPLSACTTAAGFSADPGDCDDHDPARNPAQLELCDTKDNDCDTRIDESAAAVPWYRDLDGDGFGSARSGTTSSCTVPAGYSLRGTDCDDTQAGVSPAAAELCNGVDDDCNGVADYALAPGDLEDDDGDGLADAACGAPLGVDCDDRDASSGPGTIEACDGRDNDCDGRVDENATQVAFYRDADGDGYGSTSDVRAACTAPAGYVRRGGDCDDTSATRSPTANETCDAIDQDCDGATDEGPSASASCTLAHSTMACVAGSCVTLACETGFGDCAQAVPGCESDLRSDPLHCGSCQACPSPVASCSSGRCGPVLGSLVNLTDTGSEIEVARVLPLPGSTDYIVVGRFRNTLRLGSFTLTSAGGWDGFAARMRANDTAAWANGWGGTSDDAITAAAMTPDLTGFVVGGTICNASLCGGPITGCEAFFQRFANAASPACNYADGIIVAAGGPAEIRALAMERVGMSTYVYGAGWYGGSANRALGVADAYDGFVFRARETGTQPVFEWVRPIRGDYDQIPQDLAIDGNNNLIVVGYSSGSGDFGFGPTGSAGYYDSFIADYNRTTGAPIAGFQFGSSLGDDFAYRVAALPNGNVAVAGVFPVGSYALGGQTITGGGDRNGFLFEVTPPTFGAGAYGAALSGHVNGIAGLVVSGSDVLLSGGFQGQLGMGARGTLSSVGNAAFVAAYAQGTGVIGWARQANGTMVPNVERSAGAVPLADGRLLWAIEHDHALAVPPGALPDPVGVHVLLARTFVTP